MRVLKKIRRRFTEETGSHLVEVAIGSLVMAVAVTGVMASMASGMQLVGNSRQRSSAVAVAQEKLERVRNLPYERVALKSDDPTDASDSPEPAHVAEAGHPDNNVVGEAGSLQYRVEGTDVTEPILITEDGAVRHIDDPVSVGQTIFSVFQYVTWVDDPTLSVDKDPTLPGDQDYKRVTVITTWKFPVKADTNNSVVESTFVADSAITAPESTPPPADTGPATPAPSATPGPGCPGDTTAPTGTMTLLSGAGAEEGYTNSTSAQVRFTTVDTCSHVYAELSNDGTNFTDVATLQNSQPATVAWTIPAGDGPKTVTGRLRDANNNISSLFTASVFLDQSLPTVPGNLRVVTCTLNGTDRNVSLTWDASTDMPGGTPPTLHGYRLYRSIDSEAFVPLGTTGQGSINDTSKKTAGSVRYRIRAYDRAGNESVDSNALSFAKGSC